MAKGEGKVFRDFNEAIDGLPGGRCFAARDHQGARNKRMWATIGSRKIIDTTVGRIIFNDPIPQDLGYGPHQE